MTLWAKKKEKNVHFDERLPETGRYKIYVTAPNKSSHPKTKSDLYSMHVLCLKCKSISMADDEFLYYNDKF